MLCSCRRLVCVVLVSLYAGCASYEPATTIKSARSAAEAAPTWQRAAVQGGEIEYMVRGNGDPVLLIHGSVFADAFPGLVAEPALEDYQLITYHRRGYVGSTNATTPFGLAQQADDAIAILDRLGVRRAHVVGHSYGGSIALQMAKQHPDRIATLTLLEAAVPSLGSLDEKLMRGATEAMKIYNNGDRRGALKRFSDAITPGEWEAMAAAGMTAMQDQAVADAATFFEVEMPALQQWPYTREDLARVRVPTLVVVGEKSPASFRSGHDALVQAVNGAQALVVPGAGHGLQMEQPRLVADALAAFFRKHDL